jgi:hypothetical protein
MLILKRGRFSRPSGTWKDEDFDVLADGAVVGRIFKANAAPVTTACPQMRSQSGSHFVVNTIPKPLE